MSDRSLREADSSITVAALYVLPDGPYAGRPDVDLWDEARDARLYPGPYPVVAHPPCERWGRYWSGGPSARVRRTLGDDGGCFAAALASVRRWGGVIEHPEASHAWDAHGLPSPPRWGGWIGSLFGGWACCVEQGHYGHRARKATWLYFVGSSQPPDLIWGPCSSRVRLDDGYHSAKERRAAKAASGAVELLPHRQRKLTPPQFACRLIELARGANHRGANHRA
jgi:hypothetical protein